MKPSCYNRPPFNDTVLVQDGWMWREMTRLPRMVEIPDPMSKGCQQHGPLGEATLGGWDCGGCKWKPEEPRQARSKAMSHRLETLKRYQGWRRGDDSEMLHPETIGDAIDRAIEIWEAAENIVKAIEGRHHSEMAYGRLAAAARAAITKHEPANIHRLNESTTKEQ